MKFKLDENLPELIHTTLIGLGHDARTVAEEQLAGATDDAVLRASIAERRVLITLDLDFADIRAYPPGSHAVAFNHEGYASLELKARNDSLQERKEALLAQLAAADEPPPLLHPCMADLYRSKVEELAAALQREDTRLEASEMLRGLIESIVLTRGTASWGSS